MKAEVEPCEAQHETRVKYLSVAGLGIRFYFEEKINNIANFMERGIIRHMLDQKIIIGALLVFLGGCAQTAEIGKTVWGSSTRALEEARVSAITKNYACGYFNCFNQILSASEVLEYTVFIKNPVKGTIVVIGVPDSVNTTEVGIFLTELGESEVKIYVSSLSSNAKRIVAKDLFAELDKKFSSLESLQPEEEQALLRDL